MIFFNLATKNLYIIYTENKSTNIIAILREVTIQKKQHRFFYFLFIFLVIISVKKIDFYFYYFIKLIV